MVLITSIRPIKIRENIFPLGSRKVPKNHNVKKFDFECLLKTGPADQNRALKIYFELLGL